MDEPVGRKLMEEEPLELKDGRTVIIRSARPGDGQRTHDFMLALGASTDKLLTFPGDMRTPEEFEANIEKIKDNKFYSLCAIDPETDKMIGGATFFFGARVKMSHVAGLAMGVLPDWQGNRLGAWLLDRAIQDMRKNPKIRRLDLLVMEGNDHAKAMYERAGFVVEGYREGAVIQPDGSIFGEHMMGMWIGDEPICEPAHGTVNADE